MVHCHMHTDNIIIESADSISRDGPGTPYMIIYIIHYKNLSYIKYTYFMHYYEVDEHMCSCYWSSSSCTASHQLLGTLGMHIIPSYLYYKLTILWTGWTRTGCQRPAHYVLNSHFQCVLPGHLGLCTRQSYWLYLPSKLPTESKQ